MMDEEKRYWATMGLIFAVLVMVVINHLFIQAPQSADSSHQQFFQEVRTFMSKGGRNTAEDGARRDQQLHELKLRIWELEHKEQ